MMTACLPGPGERSNGCKYYSNPFIDNHMLECLHPKNYRENLQKRVVCPGYKEGVTPQRSSWKYRCWKYRQEKLRR